MLEKCKNEHGYLLIESLLGLILLSIIAISLVKVLTTLMDTSARLDKEQEIYHRLFELHDQGIESITESDDFNVFSRGDEWCATYVWRDGNERTICL